MADKQVSTWDGTTLEVSVSPIPPPGFALLQATDYSHGAACTLTVHGVDTTYTVRWSPSVSDANATGSVLLTVTGDDLDVDGDGTITVTGARGIVRYLDTGYLWIVLENSPVEYASLAKTLLLHGGRQVIEGSGVEQPWVTGEAVTVGMRRWNQAAGDVGRLYEAITNGTTGATAPTHGSSSASDGSVLWEYVQEYMRLDAIPDLDDGDQVAWWDVSPSGDVEVFADFTFSAAETVATFEVEAHVAGEGYGDPATQTLQPADINALTAVGIAAAPAVGTPELSTGPLVKFTAVGIASASSVAQSTIAQIHVMTASSITAASAVSSPGINGTPTIETLPDMTVGRRAVISGVNF